MIEARSLAVCMTAIEARSLLVCMTVGGSHTVLKHAFSFISFEIRQQTTENFDPSIICAFLKAREVSSWFMGIMLVSCVNTVYICIGLKMFFVICNEVY
jgi:hypothetical protein